MSRWFRHYAGMMRDDKLVRAALKAGQPVERVLWVWGAILESAAEIDDGGRYDLDIAEAAYFLRTATSDIDAVVAALENGGRILGDRVVKWGNRQFQSDRSAERQKRHRDKQKERSDRHDRDDARHGDGGVTAASRHGDAPETETETETEEERKETRARPRACLWPPQAFDEFWNLYPHKIGKQAAQKSFARLSSQANAPPWERVMDGLRRYVGKTDDRPWCNPATWLNQGRWDDKPAQANGSNGVQPGSVVAAADRLLERIREFDRGDEAGGCGQSGADPVRLLPQGRGQ